MALDFASGQNVGHGTMGSWNMTVYTVIQWVRFDSWVSNGTLFKKGAAPTAQFQLAGTGGNIEAYRNSTGSDHWAGVTAPMSLSTWYCTAVTFDTSDGLRIFIGSRTTPMAEASYAYRQVGDTSIVDNSSDTFRIGGYPAETSMDGQIAWTAAYSSRFSLAQLIIHQRRSQAVITSGCKLLAHYGVHGSGGTGTQKDWSGNAYDGTITGATKADHPGLSIFPYSILMPSLPSTAPIAGSVVWGHVTGATEDNIRTFLGNWTGTGTIEGSGDAERLVLDSGEYMEGEIVNTGLASVTLLQNEYASGSTVSLKYRYGATEAECASGTYSSYVSPFLSSGYAQVRVESTL